MSRPAFIVLDVVAAVAHDDMTTTRAYSDDTGLSFTASKRRYLEAYQGGYLSRVMVGKSHHYAATPAGLSLVTR